MGSNLLLIDYTSRLCRTGKARVGREVATILARQGTRVEVWGERINELFSRRRLLGSYFATDRQRLRKTIANDAPIEIMRLIVKNATLELIV